MLTPKSLLITAERIIDGTLTEVAIKEHIDEWNTKFSSSLFADEPPLTGVAFIDVWMAGAAEYEAFMIGHLTPDWAEKPDRFLNQPYFDGGKFSRMIAMAETPFSFRRRLLFIGKTTILPPSFTVDLRGKCPAFSGHSR